MEFKLFFQILKNRISDGDDVPGFMRYLISSITELNEDEWDAPKDPAGQVKESTLRNYSKKNISKKLARSILYRLNKDNFIDEISEKPNDVLELLAEDIRPYEPTVTEKNIGEILADIFIDIIRTAAGLTAPDKLEEQKQLNSSTDFKKKYGRHLLKESDNHCAMPGCGKLLYVSNGGKVKDVYEVAIIDSKAAPDLKNLISLCPHCFATYQLDRSSRSVKLLKQSKKSLSVHMESMLELSSIELEEGLVNVISKLSKLKYNDLTNLTMEPRQIKQKIDPETNLILYNQVNMAVTTYFLKIKEIFINLDKRQVIDYEELQYQIRSAYKKLNKGKYDVVNIFNNLSEKIHKVTLQDISYCQLIVCYFIQSCEVLDAITK